MAVSHDTLVRLMRRSEPSETPTPRILGIDDFAWRKGRRYGTILVDLETHQVVDVLPNREGETVLAWLRTHPGVEIVSRDRASAYADAARQALPEATQVADRFHLLMNIRETMQRVLERKRSCLAPSHHEEIPSQEAVPASTGNEATLSVEESQPGEQRLLNAETEAEPPTLTFTRDPVREHQFHESQQRRRHMLRTARQDRFDEVRDLHRQGVSARAIARSLGISRQTVQKYLRAEPCPHYASRGRSPMPSKLDPFVPFLLTRWVAGCRNGSQLYQELREQGYRGSRSLLGILLADMRRTLPQAMLPRQRRTGVVAPHERPRREKLQIKLLPGRRRLSPRRASWLFVSAPEVLTERQRAELEQLRQAAPELHRAYEFVQCFVHMVTERKAGQLEAWLVQAEASGIIEFKGFAQGIRRDSAAVLSALSTDISNGQVEGQVNRLKLINRQGYGRAGFDLLRLRVLHGSGQLLQQMCV
jgi:transposase